MLPTVLPVSIFLPCDMHRASRLRYITRKFSAILHLHDKNRVIVIF